MNRLDRTVLLRETSGMTLVPSILLVMFFGMSGVQAGEFVWAKQLGGTGYDRADGVALDSGGNVYTVGYFGGTVDFDPGPGVYNLTSAGGSDTFISKLDSAGNFVWARRLGGTGEEYARGVALDSGGNVTTVGYFGGTVDFDPGPGVYNLTSAGGSDTFISKLDSAGNFVWARRLGGTGDDRADGVALDSGGNVYTVGGFHGTVDFDPGPGVYNLTSAGSSDTFISKLGPSTSDGDGDGYSPATGDCDDTDPAIHPGASEICDTRDNDCNGVTDDVDTDGDGWDCKDECNDFNPLTYPGAAEICDLEDNDCDGTTDEGYDTDGDGWSSCENDCIEDGVVTDEACPQGNHGHQPDVPYGGDPVNLANGNFTDSWIDLAMPGPGIGFAFVRSYNSRHPENGPLGYGWTHSYNMKLELLPSGSYSVLFGDGHKEVFTPDGAGGYTPHGGVRNVLSDNGDGTFSLLRRSDRLRFDLDTAGRLAAILDKNGNTVQCLYTGALLTSVIDDAGRTVTFSYDGNNRIGTITDHLPTPDTRTVHYTYDGAGDLVSVQNVRGNTTGFTYDAEHQLLTLTDRRGNLVVSNTYDALNRVVSYQQDYFGHGTSYVYDPVLRKTTVTDPLTHVTVFWFDENGHTLRVEDPLGYELSYVYTPSDEKESMTDKTGKTTNFTWDYRGNMLTRTDPDGAVTRFTYNTDDRVTEKEDPLGNVTYYTYDANGNLETTTDRLSETETRTYTPKGLLDTLTDRRGKVWDYAYDTAGNLVSEKDPLLNETVHAYDGVGRRESTTDPELNLTQFGYDEAGNLVLVTDALGRQSVYEYDENGNRTKRTDAVTTPKERETRWEYDEKNRLVKVIDPELNETEYGYDANDRKTSMIDPRDYSWGYEYDGMGNLTKVIDPLLGETRYEYDGLGRRTSKFDAANNETTYTYDAMGRLLTVADPLGNVTERTYYLTGDLKTLTDPLDRTTTYEYDAEQRLTAIVDPLGGRSEFEYDEEGHRTKLINANLHETLYTYDDAGRLQTEKGPLLNTWTYEYDGVGNRIKRTDPDLRETDYSYDALSRLDGITYPDAGTVAYVYDEVGNRTSMTDAHGTVAYIYDDNDRLTQVTDAYGRVVSYGYDAAGNRTSITYPGSLTVSYTYDEVGRLETVSDWLPGGTATYTYTLAGDLDTVTYPNGTVEELDHDTARRLTSIVHDDGLGGTIASYAITLDGAGQRTAIDVVQPLTSTLADLAESYAYNVVEEVLSRGAWAYTHDDLGNLTGATSASSTLGYQYDYDSRMVGVNRDGVTDQYGYDADGARFIAVRGAMETRYLLDRAAPMVSSLAEIDALETITRYDIHGHRLLWSLDGSGNRFVYHTDSVGSVVAITDDMAAIVAAFAYDEFGSVTASTGPYTTDAAFVGSLGVTEEPSGLYFMRARHYDPLIGRFLAEDPVEIVGGRSMWLNPYVYVGNSPQVLSDPSGLFSFREFGGQVGNLAKDIGKGIVKEIGGRITGASSFALKTGNSLLSSAEGYLKSNVTGGFISRGIKRGVESFAITKALDAIEGEAEKVPFLHTISGPIIGNIFFRVKSAGGEETIAEDGSVYLNGEFVGKIEGFKATTDSTTETPETPQEFPPELAHLLRRILGPLLERFENIDKNAPYQPAHNTSLPGECVKCPPTGSGQ